MGGGRVDTWWMIAILASLLAATLAFLYVAFALKAGSHGTKKPSDNDPLDVRAEQAVEHLFDDDFREELRNRGRLHFEKIIGENAMFLQQDLRLTTSQLNDYMKTEITSKLTEEFAKYEESITDAKQLAIDSINKTQEAIEEQRSAMGEQLTKQIATEKARQIKQFEENMADIINHYVLAAVGDQIDLNDQLEYVIQELNENKKDIIEDITYGG